MRYRVTSPVNHGTSDHDQRRYQVGEMIDLNESDAGPLLKCRAIEPEHKPFDIEVNRVFINAKDRP